MSFYDWLIINKSQKGGSIGKFAHIVREDINFPRRASRKKTLDEYLKSIELDEPMWEVFEKLYIQYTAYLEKRDNNDG